MTRMGALRAPPRMRVFVCTFMGLSLGGSPRVCGAVIGVA